MSCPRRRCKKETSRSGLGRRCGRCSGRVGLNRHGRICFEDTIDSAHILIVSHQLPTPFSRLTTHDDPYISNLSKISDKLQRMIISSFAPSYSSQLARLRLYHPRRSSKDRIPGRFIASYTTSVPPPGAAPTSHARCDLEHVARCQRCSAPKQRSAVGSFPLTTLRSTRAREAIRGAPVQDHVAELLPGRCAGLGGVRKGQ
ncbi:hypothetical protein FA95DRAFT_1115229 [Auriscalpium vulgare]|uniref:Uncharacterized protein n=1 Tax=Auriscalpium vulgare TaxID=40419 RepID=A0ACB8R4M3_9AGAM|nr:hypothetical protein FA95DRAFT_1115229 [Auriscalpium vulgare]